MALSRLQTLKIKSCECPLLVQCFSSVKCTEEWTYIQTCLDDEFYASEACPRQACKYGPRLPLSEPFPLLHGSWLSSQIPCILWRVEGARKLPSTLKFHHCACESCWENCPFDCGQKWLRMKWLPDPYSTLVNKHKLAAITLNENP